jgi:hypothetical protein
MFGISYKTAWYLCHRIRKNYSRYRGRSNGPRLEHSVTGSTLGTPRTRKTVWYRTQGRSILLSMPERNFDQIAHDLDQAVSKLEATKDTNLRRILLLQLRRLPVEADSILLEAAEQHVI